MCVVVALVVAVLGGAVAVVRARAGGGPMARVAVLVTRPVGSGPVTVDRLTLAGGVTAELASAVSAPVAPARAEAGVVDVPAGDVDGVRLRIGGRDVTVNARAHLVAGSLRPLLVVTDGTTGSAAWGNVGVNDALQAAAGLLPRPPDVAFTDQSGTSVPWASLRGHVVVAAALDTGCSETCPLYTAVLQDAERVLRARGWADRVRIVDISMDPDRDTSAELAAYSQRFGADWELLRADPESTQRFWNALHASYVRLPASPGIVDWYTGLPEKYHLHHDSLAFVVDPGGLVRATLQGVPRLGHGLSPALAAQLSGSAALADQEKVAAWTVTDLLDRVDAALGEPAEADRGVEGAARTGSRAPDITLPTVDGPTASLHDSVGHPVIVNFFASWCEPCRRELPALVAAVRADPHLSLLLVDEGESAGEARAFVASVVGGALPAGSITVLDGDRSVGGSYAATGLPVSVFVDSDGVVRSTHVGQLDAASLHSGIAATGS